MSTIPTAAPAPIFGTGGVVTAAQLAKFGINNPTPVQLGLFKKLLEINGQDAYSEVSQALGKLVTDEYLRLPIGFVLNHKGRVGELSDFTELPIDVRAQIYAMNKLPKFTVDEQVKIATIRLQAIALGWPLTQISKEVTYELPPNDAVTTYLNDLSSIDNVIIDATTIAFLLPMIAEFVFRTTGHHFLTGMQADYVKKYQKVFTSCLANNCANFLPPPILYHVALHWVTPGTARTIAKELVANNAEYIPDAIKIRLSALPAGTAVIGITAAVSNSFKAAGLFDDIVKFGKFPLEEVITIAETIKKTPEKYHKAYFAYGVTPPTTAEKQALADAILVCQNAAPICQAFIEAMFQMAALGQAKALKKLAENEPILLKRATKFFRSLSKQTVNKIEEIFNGIVSVPVNP